MIRLVLLVTLGLAICTCRLELVAAADEPATDKSAADIVVADFEGDSYGDWKTTGEAFGTAPAKGTLPGQMQVSGYQGQRLVNSFLGGDDAQGTLTSPPLKITRKYLQMLIGGGKWPGQTCVNLLVDGKVVRTATGRNSQAGGSEHLQIESWDVADLVGKQAVIEIVDRRQGGWGHINVDQIVATDRKFEPKPEREDLLERADRSVAMAAARAQADVQRPTFHLLPRANWLNDPNGPIFHGGYYHLFFQHNPYGDTWGNMHWAHVRSKDLAHWEHLPIALWPSKSQGEEHVFSGCAEVNGQGELMLFYTSIGAGRAPEQWAAIATDDDAIHWKKHPGNPLLTEKLHGSTKVHEWRDPYTFRHQGRVYMVAGGNLNATAGGQGTVQLYRAEDETLADWKFLGVLFTHPDKEVKNVECPLFFQMGDKWVLIVSAYRAPEYFVGTFDPAKPTFKFTARGPIDGGSIYAPNVLQQKDGRRLLWNWVQGFREQQGWNGCLTLPRELSIGPSGQLQQTPARELKQLRGKNFHASDVKLSSTPYVADSGGAALEIVAAFDLQDAKSVGLGIKRSADGNRSVPIRVDRQQLRIGDKLYPLVLPADQKTIELHMFVDHSVIEVYTQGQTFTRVLYAEPQDQGVEVTADGTTALKSLDIWQMNSGWVEETEK